MPLALADELFLITHDAQTGKGRLSEPALSIGLSAALLADLLFAGSLRVREGRVSTVDAPAPDAPAGLPPQGPGEQPAVVDLPVEEWLVSRRQTARREVADRLVASGELRRHEARRFGRTVVRFHAARPAESYVRAQRLGAYLRTRSQLGPAEVALAALVVGIAPGGDLLALDDGERAYLATLTPGLPPSVQELLAITRAVVRAAHRNPYL